MEQTLNHGTLVFLFYLEKYYPLLGLYFQLNTPSLKLVSEFESLNNFKEMGEFTLRIHDKIIPYTSYLDRVKLAHLFIEIYGHSRQNEEHAVKVLHLNEDWKDEGISLSKFMFYEKLTETDPKQIKQFCRELSYHTMYVVKNHYKKDGMSTYIQSDLNLMNFIMGLRDDFDQLEIKLRPSQNEEEIEA